ncbi:944_t:CDS:2 [Ambispora leptoticha]|uniref:944_t:CDS:1 n=1 Tax=Ambispora leptoticha TaxID=144679 RepID=A0A9N9AMQ0_9GLOM|nr:944_t:CDS:2 [Ambispora leptoticha]
MSNKGQNITIQVRLIEAKLMSVFLAQIQTIGRRFIVSGNKMHENGSTRKIGSYA